MKNIAKWLLLGLFATIICTTVQVAATAEDIEIRKKQESERAALRAMNEHNLALQRAQEDARKKLGQREQHERDVEEADRQLMAAGLQGSLEDAPQENAQKAPTKKREEYVFPQARIDNPDRQLLMDQELYGELVQLKYRLKAAKTKEQPEKTVNYSHERINELLAKGSNPRAIMLDKNNRPASIIDIATIYLGPEHSIVKQLQDSLTPASRELKEKAQKDRERDKKWAEGESGAAALKEEQNKLPGGLANLVKGFAQPSWTDKDVEIDLVVIPSSSDLVAISPDGNFIVTGSKKNTLAIWNSDGTPLLNEAGQQVVLNGHTRFVTSVAISSDNSFVVTGSWDNTARIWDATTGALQHTLVDHTNLVNSVAISSNNSFIVTGSSDGTARIWDARTGALRHTLAGHTDRVASVAISSDNRFIVTGSVDNTARIWDARTGQWRYTLAGHTGQVDSVAISSDNSFIVTGSDDKTARIWNASTGQWRYTLAGHTSFVTSVAISSDNSFIVTGSLDNTARIWDPRTGALLHTLEDHTGQVTSVAISPDNNFIVTGSFFDGTARICDAKTGKLLNTLPGHTEEVYSVAISSDNSFIVSGSKDGTARIWRLRQ